MPTKIGKEIEEALDELRDAFVNRDYHKADKLKRIISDFIEPAGYTIVEDPKKVFVIKKLVGGKG